LKLGWSRFFSKLDARDEKMKYTGFAVLLIVPLAFIMICGAVLLEQSGLMNFLRRLLRAARSWFR